MMKKANHWRCVMATLLMLSVVACKNNEQGSIAGEDGITQLQGEMIVPYIRIQDFYNIKKGELPEDGKIVSEREFERHFAEADLTGTGTEPVTPDFKQQFVLAFALSAKEKGHELNDVRLLDNGEQLALEYNIEHGKNLSDKRPAIILLVDKKYESRQVVFRKTTDD